MSAEALEQVQSGLSADLTDLSQCNSEPVSLIGSIQPRGFALFFTKDDRRVQAASQNARVFLAKASHKEILGSKLEHLISMEAVHEIDRLLTGFPREGERGLHFTSSFGGREYDTYLYETQGLFGVEFEENVQWVKEGRTKVDRAVRVFMSKAKTAGDAAQLAKHACVAIREIIGFDRVMMYQFMAPNWHGQVIAEDRVMSAHSYDGHRFPASDIPRPARDLYLRNGLRVISDSSAQAVAIEPSLNPLTKKPLNLSDSRLRAVSPIHLEYLRNMGVKASFSFAVTIDGQLWGLIACHHSEISGLSIAGRAACELISNFLSCQIPLLERSVTMREELQFYMGLSAFFESLQDSPEPISQLFRQHTTLEKALNVGGIAYVHRDRVDFAGLTPTRTQLVELADFVTGKMRESDSSTFVSSQLADVDSKWSPLKEVVSGILAVSTGEGPDDGVFMVMRPELVRTITWGGDPRKGLEKKNFTGRINPRTSFESWEEVILETSPEWRAHEIKGMGFIRDRVFGLFVTKERLIKELSDDLAAAKAKNK